MLDLIKITNRYWYEWIRQSTYSGSWKEAVHRSALALKLLIFEPTGASLLAWFELVLILALGAVVASPTFSLPEYIGGTRNWLVCRFFCFIYISKASVSGIIGTPISVRLLMTLHIFFQCIMDPWFVVHSLCASSTWVHTRSKLFVHTSVYKGSRSMYDQHTWNLSSNAWGTRTPMEACRLCTLFMVLTLLFRIYFLLNQVM